MNDGNEPLVSLVTSTHNGAAFLDECIESALRQTYRNWEYIILDNASTDGTLAIAQEYGRRDGRIRAHSCDELQPIIANHNKALSLIAKDSKYCKIILPDDLIFPECLEKMVDLAEAYPSIAIVSAYQLSGGRDIWYVRNAGLSYSTPVISGHEICRAQLLGRLNVFGNPTSVLYRADLVRSTDAFFPNPTLDADTSACLKWLRSADFGFVHQVLTHERINYDRLTAKLLRDNTHLAAEIRDCQEYGDWYLSHSEKEKRIKQLITQYYWSSSPNPLELDNRHFWIHQGERLNALIRKFGSVKLFKHLAAKFVALILNRKAT